MHDRRKAPSKPASHPLTRERVRESLELLAKKNHAGGIAAEDEIVAQGASAIPYLSATLRPHHPALDRWVVFEYSHLLFPVFLGLSAVSAFTVPSVGFTVVFAAAAGVFLWAAIPRRVPEASIRMLLRIDDLGTLPPLLAAWSRTRRADLRQAIRQRLTLLLPRLSRGDAPVLSPLDRQRIYRMIAVDTVTGTGADSALVIAGIKALVQIGDTQSLPLLHHLAAQAPDEEVRRMAARGAAMLQAAPPSEGPR